VKRCSKCGETKPLDDFSRRADRPDGRQGWCRACHKAHRDRTIDPATEKERRRAYYQANKERINAKNGAWYAANRERALVQRREYHIRRTYGLSVEQYADLVRGGCDICGSGDNLHVDHDHSCCPRGSVTCGRCVRGVLCGPCNTALHKDVDLAWLESATSYLKRWQSKRERMGV